MGTRASVRGDQPALRGYEWRTPGLVARCVLEGSEPRFSGRDALAAFDLAAAADESWRTGQTVTIGRKQA